MKTRGLTVCIVVFLSSLLKLAAQETAPAEAASMESVEGDSIAVPDGSEAFAATSEPEPSDSGGKSAPEDGGRAQPNNLNFQTDLFTGRFTYRIPIAVPPARGNSQPDIALTYNSSGANGWCGVGWALDVGYIERETKFGAPVKWSGASPLSAYDDDKGFVFSFQGSESRLVKVGQSGGADEYRAEVETGSFLRFLYYNPTGLNPYWKVIGKSGSCFYFGESTASRMTNSKWPSNYGTSTFRRWQALLPLFAC